MTVPSDEIAASSAGWPWQFRWAPLTLLMDIQGLHT
jgi:hypothetical protein